MTTREPEQTGAVSTPDVLVVGAGFAGLAAALMLRRHRVRVTVVDGGPTRNALAREVHGFPGAADLSARELRARICEQALDVGAAIVPDRIVSAKREGDGFRLSGETRDYRATRLLIATGARDVLPPIERLDEFYGRSVHLCPHCDAYEWREQPIAIVASCAEVTEFALKMTDWSPRVTVVADPRACPVSDDERRQLDTARIRLIVGEVKRFEGEDGRLSSLVLEDGSSLPARAAFLHAEQQLATELAETLGCRLNEEGAVAVDDEMRTSVEGVWAAGDVVGDDQMVAFAVAHGVRAALDIYRTSSPVA